ncbi:MAG: hypothetical protein WAT51_09085 [Holophaga sp.]
MESKNRREILGSVAALLAAPLALGKEAVVDTFFKTKAEPEPRLAITPPAHSVKRRG